MDKNKDECFIIKMLLKIDQLLIRKKQLQKEILF